MFWFLLGCVGLCVCLCVCLFCQHEGNDGGGSIFTGAGPKGARGDATFVYIYIYIYSTCFGDNTRKTRVTQTSWRHKLQVIFAKGT